MLAGYYLCHSNGHVSADRALEFMKEQDWKEMTSAEEKDDTHRCLDHIMTHIIRVKSEINLTVGELIDCALDRDSTVIMDEARRLLRRHGIAVKTPTLDQPHEGVFIANNHQELGKMLDGTPWAANWKSPLLLLDGAERTDPIKFSTGVVQRAVKIPLQYFLKGD